MNAVLIAVIIILCLGSAILDHIRKQNIKGLANEIIRTKDYLGQITASFSDLEKELRGKNYNLMVLNSELKTNIKSLKEQLESQVNAYQEQVNAFEDLNVENVLLQIEVTQLNSCYNALCNSVEMKDEFRIKLPDTSKKMIDQTYDEIKEDIKNVG